MAKYFAQGSFETNQYVLKRARCRFTALISFGETFED